MARKLSDDRAVEEVRKLVTATTQVGHMYPLGDFSKDFVESGWDESDAEAGLQTAVAKGWLQRTGNFVKLMTDKWV
jgi:hypothetical protein